jgi:hypothetical protein
MASHIGRRKFLATLGGAAALPAISRIAWAQAYPARPVRIIVGFPAGGPADILARLISQWLSERLGQQFIVENRPGAGSNIATEAVVRAPADGYILLLITSTNAINTTLYEKLSFNFSREIVPVASPHPCDLCSGDKSVGFRPRRFQSSSLMPRPIPASSPWRRVGSELLPMSPASCLSL